MEEVTLSSSSAEEIGPERFAFKFGSHRCVIPIAFAGADAGTAKRALVTVHGRRRDAVEYARITAKAFCSQIPDLLVAAPQFLTSGDIVAHHCDSEVAHWNEAGWIQGDDSVGPHPISSFAVLEALIASLADLRRSPGIEQIVVAGHSAGAQLVHRFALLSPIERAVQFVVANPSAYVWFGPDRPVPSPGTDGHDRWKYGLQDRPSYGGNSDEAALERRYVGRDVLYLLGQADCNPDHPALDRSPPANAQGPNRLARGRNYWALLTRRHGAALRHRYIEIPDVGHDPAGMLAAEATVRAIWQRPAITSPT